MISTESTSTSLHAVHLLDVRGTAVLVDRVGEAAHALNDAGAAFVRSLQAAGLAMVHAGAATSPRDPFVRGDRSLTDVHGQVIGPLGPPARRYAHRCGPYRALDLCFVVHCDDPAVASLLDQLLGPLADGDPSDAYHVELFSDVASPGACGLRFNGRELRPALAPEVALVGLFAQLNLAALWATDRRFAFHGGAVAIGGTGVALVGGSGSGKSTLVASLLQRGAAYLTDEVVWLAQDGPPILRPFPKPIALEHPPDDLRAAVPAHAWHDVADGLTLVAPGALGPAAVADPAPLGMVVDVRYEPGRRDVSWTPLSLTDALAVLLGNHYAIDCFDETAAAAVGRMASVPCVALRHGGHLDACSRILAEVPPG